MGNFIYIDTDNWDYPEKISEAVTQSLGIATSMAGQPKLKLKFGNQAPRVVKFNSLYEFEKKEIDP